MQLGLGIEPGITTRRTRNGAKDGLGMQMGMELGNVTGVRTVRNLGYALYRTWDWG